jgi:hypothetical protein
MLLVARTPTRSRTLLAALLSVLAVLAKFTAVVAPVTIVLWFLWRGPRRSAVLYAATYLVLLAAAFAALEVVTGGRFSSNLRELGVPIPTIEEILKTPSGLVGSLEAVGSILLLVPLVIARYVLGLRRADGTRASIWDIALPVALAVVLVVYTDQGAYRNHLLDLCALLAIVAAELWPALTRDVATERAGRTTFVTTVLLAAVVALATGPGIDFALAVRGRAASPPMYDPQLFAGHIQPGERILSDDAYVPLSVGAKPVVLDAFALARYAPKHPDWVAQLVDRIRSRSFDVIVLVYDVQTVVPETYEGPHLPDADAAIAENYRVAEVLRSRQGSSAFVTPTYVVYRPR